jgi:PQQ-like domain
MRRTLRRRGLVAWAGVVALGTAGCWPQVGQGPDRTGHNGLETRITVDTVATLEQEWVANLGPGLSGGEVVASPRTGVIASGGVLAGIDLSSGAIRWTQRSTQFGWRDPFMVGEQVVVGRSNVDARTLTFDEMTGVQVADRVDRIETRRGTRRIHVQTSAIATPQGFEFFHRFTAETDGVPADAWAGLYGGPGGSQAGRLTLGAERIYATGVGLLADNVQQGNGIRAFDQHSPNLCGRGDFKCTSWATSLPGSTTTAAVVGPGETTLYAATDGGTVAAVDAATGALQWSAEAGAPVDDPPALADGVLYVATRTGQVLAFAADGCGAPSCTPTWRFEAGGQVVGQPSVAGGVVFVATTSGRLVAVDAAGCGAATCAPIMVRELGTAVTAPPIVAYGRVLVGTFTGVVSFRPATP